MSQSVCKTGLYNCKKGFAGGRFMAVGLEPENNGESQDKFTILFNFYGNALKRKAKTILYDDGWAEDAVQWTFMKLLNHMDAVDDPFSRSTKSYLYTILVNNCYSILKSNHKYHLMDDDTMQAECSTKLTKNDDTSDRIIYKELLNDIRKIPEIYSQILILNVIYHYSLQEISVMLEIKPATVRKRAQRGREMLSKLKTELKEPRTNPVRRGF
jgi:RNA polymerase sigma-70 factor (ECF subfamily)